MRRVGRTLNARKIYPQSIFERFEALLRILRPESAMAAKLPMRLRLLFGSAESAPAFDGAQFLQFLFGFRFRRKKKALSLSVDLEPIEVIMIFAAALWKVSQSSARMRR
jgi:hypothetical protein